MKIESWSEHYIKKEDLKFEKLSCNDSFMLTQSSATPIEYYLPGKSILIVLLDLVRHSVTPVIVRP